MIKLGLIYFPSIRANAYLNILDELGVEVSSIIILRNNYSLPLASEEELETANHYLNAHYDIESYLENNKVEVIDSGATHINDDAIFDLLGSNSEVNWLFTGGGILSRRLFNIGKKFLHIHPGKLPEYKGSTCFYYSLLKDRALSASVFYLSLKLDSGVVLKQCDFELKVDEVNTTSYFFDYVVDPWIRAQTLKAYLLEGADKELESNPVQSSVYRGYYVMHPVLRALTMKKVLNIESVESKLILERVK